MQNPIHFPPAPNVPLRRGRCPHRLARFRVQRISMAAFAVGAACMAARAAPPRRMHHRRPHPGRRGALIGSPVGSTTRFRAAIQAAPTDAPPIRFVGRGAHTPPNQAAGIAGLASIAAAAGPLVGAGFMPARAAPPGATGPRSSRPGHGGMWACRPTAFGEVRQKPEGVLGRI